MSGDNGLTHRTRALGASAKVLGAGVVLALFVLTALAVFRLERLERAAVEERDLIAAQAALLVECTTAPAEREPPIYSAPPGDCYVRSARRTTDVVGQIGDISIIAAACGAANPGDVPATRRCVEEAMDR